MLIQCWDELLLWEFSAKTVSERQNQTCSQYNEWSDQTWNSVRRNGIPCSSTNFNYIIIHSLIWLDLLRSVEICWDLLRSAEICWDQLRWACRLSKNLLCEPCAKICASNLYFESLWKSVKVSGSLWESKRREIVRNSILEERESDDFIDRTPSIIKLSRKEN